MINKAMNNLIRPVHLLKHPFIANPSMSELGVKMTSIRILMICLLGLAFSFMHSEGANAASAARGKSLYTVTPSIVGTGVINCADSNCHGSMPSTKNMIANGKTASVIQSAINGNAGGMGVYGPVGGAAPRLTTTDLADIAAYITSPSSAILLASTAALTFSPVLLNAAAPTQNITVTNDGSANLNVTSALTSGANAANFTASHNCTNIASAATCTITVTMLTTVGGSKTATLTIASNGGASKLVALSGTVSGTPSASLNAPGGGLTFPDTIIGATSVASNLPVVTLTNNGSAPLNISALTASTGFNLNLTLGTACKVGTPVAAGQNCTLSVRFAPGSATLINGSLSIAHNAAASPSTINLSGTGLASTTAAAALDKSSLSFGDHTVGTTSATQTVTLTSSGASALTITNIQSSSTEFIRTGNCGAGPLPVNATCAIIVAFTPASIGSKNASITITDDAGNVPGSTQIIDLSGMAVAVALPAPSLTATSLTFSDQSLNTASPAQIVTITNTNPSDAIVLSEISKTGVDAGDYTIDAAAMNACSITAPVLPSASCDLSVTFTPAATGARVATLAVTTNATGSPHAIALTGTGTGMATPLGSSTGAVSTNAGGGGCAMQSRGGFDPLILALFLLSIFGTMMRRRRAIPIELRPARD